MAFTRTQIISNALTILGKGVILSTVGQSTLVDAMAQAFDFLLPCKLSEHFWRFATTIAQLNQTVNVPIVTNWRYEYQIPGDYLETVRLYPQMYNWEIYQSSTNPPGALPVIYSNFNGPLYLEYVRQVDPTLLPAYFVHYFVYELALYGALSSAQQTQFATVLEKWRDTQLGIAQAKDAQNRPQTPLASQPMITNRFVATWIGG